MSPLSTPPGNDALRSRQLAWILAVAYTLLIAYASLLPLRGWRMTAEPLFVFLAAPWPRYITLEDVAINFAAYVPLGFLLAVALANTMPVRAAVVLATAVATALSFSMECIQTFLPARIASNVDLVANGAGALFGAMAAPILSPRGIPGRRIATWRNAMFEPGARIDAGLVIVLLWLIAQLHPTAQAFGTGNLRVTLELPVYFTHTPDRLFLAETLVVALNLLALGLLIAVLMRDPRRVFPATILVVALGLALRTVAGFFLFETPGPFSWLTPGVGLGLVAGAICLYPLLYLPQPAKLGLALLCLTAAVAVLNVAPDNPYQTLPAKLVYGNPSRLLHFSSISRALSELWPFLAGAYLTGLLVRRVFR